jgi:large subunit ribosomal protein L10
MAKTDKATEVKDITQRFRDADAALLTEYRGLSVGDMAEVRRSLGEADADYKVLKNTLTRIAVRAVGLDELVGMLEGPTAIAFCRGDAAAAAKSLDEAAKRFPVLEVKGGVLLGKVISAEEARRLARLEPREVQLAQIAMLLSSPLQQIVNVFAGLLRDLGSMLAQVVSKKESGELASGSAQGRSPSEAEQVGAQTESPPEGAVEDPIPTTIEETGATAPTTDEEA